MKESYIYPFCPDCENEKVELINCEVYGAEYDFPEDEEECIGLWAGIRFTFRCPKCGATYIFKRDYQSEF